MIRYLDVMKFKLILLLFFTVTYVTFGFISSTPNGSGGWNHSDGSHSTPNGSGGWNHSDGSSSTSNGSGSWIHSDGSYSKPNGSGGWYHY